MERKNLNEEVAWKKLGRLYEKLQHSLILKDLFVEDPDRFQKYCKTLNTPDGEMLFDFSKNLVNKKVLDTLFQLAKDRRIEEHRDRLFNGEKVNFTEERSVLHIALRNRSNKAIVVDGLNVMSEIHKVLKRMETFVDAVRSGEWLGYTGEKITDIVNIGVGGFDMGPHMVTEALKPYGSNGPVKVHFVSNVDGTQLIEVLKRLKAQTTLFVIASKTFSSHETSLNALSAKMWFLENSQYCCDSMDGYQHKAHHHMSNHFVAVSKNAQKVEAFGIGKRNMFELWEWVGAQYSVWSAVGLSVALFIGFGNFIKLLEGANFADDHFKTAPMEDNIPMLMGLIGVWYNNFYGAETHAILPYDQYLHRFATYFQQGDMESNGKSINGNESGVNYHTGQIVWGQPGTNCQHTFFQLIHQGTRMIPCDFIAPINTHNPVRGGVHHEVLLANFLAQTESLMIGKTIEEVYEEMEADNVPVEKMIKLAPHKVFNGNHPSNAILLPRVTPFTLGALIALYEHKIFVQGAIWDINSFDEYGVDIGKKLAKTIHEELRSDLEATSHDPSTNNLINYIKVNRA